MKKIVRLTESDLIRLVKKVINEQKEDPNSEIISHLKKLGYVQADESVRKQLGKGKFADALFFKKGNDILAINNGYVTFLKPEGTNIITNLPMKIERFIYLNKVPYQNSLDDFNRFLMDTNWKIKNPTYRFETLKDNDNYILRDKKSGEPDRIFKFNKNTFKEIKPMGSLRIFDEIEIQGLKQRQFKINSSKSEAFLEHPITNEIFIVKPAEIKRNGKIHSGYTVMKGKKQVFELPHDEADVALDKLIGWEWGKFKK